MSHSTFRLTPRAYEDMKSIARYTLQQWGNEQRKKYLKAIEERFHWLADNPKAGRNRYEIGEHYLSFPQGRHVIFYVMSENGIDIIGVVHQQMDVMHYFGIDD